MSLNIVCLMSTSSDSCRGSQAIRRIFPYGAWRLIRRWGPRVFAGATSGIGKESARVLAKHGAHVILEVCNVKLGEEVCGEIHRETPAAHLDVIRLDLNSLASVREFAADFKA